MASKKKVTIEIDVEVLEKLIEATEALSELAVALQTGSDDAAARALGKKKSAKKRAKK
jgi:hypothetical protein